MGGIIYLISTQRRRACWVTSTHRGISPQRASDDDEEEKEEAPVKSGAGVSTLLKHPSLGKHKNQQEKGRRLGAVVIAAIRYG